MADTAPAQFSRSVGHRERRRKLRKSAEDLSLVTVEMGSAGFGLMLDVSEGGVGVQVMTRVEPGTDVQIAFKVPELASRIEGTGVVTWCDGEGRLGIRFQQLNDKSGDQLKQWVDSLPEAPTQQPMELPVSSPAVTEHVRAIKAQIAASKLDVDLVLQFLVERVVELTNANGGAVALGDASDMVCRASSGLAPDVGVTIGTDSALTSECIRSGRTVRCDDTETDLRVDRAICRELDLRSSLILPVLFEGKVKGVLEVFSPIPKAFNEKHLTLLQQLAAFTAQIVYGPMPASAAEIELSARAKAKPEHTALSALLTATTSAADINAPEIADLTPSKEAEPSAEKVVVPPPSKPAPTPSAPQPAKSVSSNGAAAKPAPITPVVAAPPSPAKETTVQASSTPREPVIALEPPASKQPAVTAEIAKESLSAKEPVAKEPTPTKPVVAAEAIASPQPLVKELVPPVATEPAQLRSEPSLDLLSTESQADVSSYRAVYIAVAVLLILSASGGFYLAHRQPAAQSSASQTPTLQQPQSPPAATSAPDAQPATPPVATAMEPTTIAHSASPAKPPTGLVAADTIRTPHAAIVKADQSSPLVIAQGTKPQPKPDIPPDTPAPSVAVNSNANLPGMVFPPGATARPDFKPQGVVSGGNLLKRVEPVYPEFAKVQHLQGDIVLSARVTKDGSLDRIKRVKGNPVFEPASVAALHQWRYAPYKLNGQPQDVDITVTLQFRLKQ